MKLVVITGAEFRCLIHEEYIHIKAGGKCGTVTVKCLPILHFHPWKPQPHYV